MTIAPAPSALVLKESVVEIEGVDWRKSVSNVTLTPSSSAITWQGLSPDASFSDAANATWTVALTYVQDWDSAQSLSGYLFNNEGDTVTMTFRPKAASGSAFAAEVTIVPGAIGGAVNSYAEQTVTLGVVGRPVRVATP